MTFFLCLKYFPGLFSVWYYEVIAHLFIYFYSKFYFYFECVCMHTCVCTYKCRTHRGQWRSSDSIEIELQVVVSLSRPPSATTWMLRTEFGSSEKAVLILISWAISPAPCLFIVFIFLNTIGLVRQHTAWGYNSVLLIHHHYICLSSYLNWIEIQQHI